MHRVQAEVERQLAAAGAGAEARLHAAYFCTVPPSADADTAPDRRSRVEHPDRKPGPGMLLRAAKEHGLDVSRSVMVGDMLSDVLAGKNAGVAASIHVKTGHGMTQPEAMQVADFAARDLLEAAEWIVARANERMSE
jgi:D-glycero-D-manno-heptose 1,7-bisphosphate phosphatase